MESLKPLAWPGRGDWAAWSLSLHSAACIPLDGAWAHCWWKSFPEHLGAFAAISPASTGVIWWANSHSLVNDSVCGLLSSPRRQRQGISNNGISQMPLTWERVSAENKACSSPLVPPPCLTAFMRRSAHSQLHTFCSDMGLAICFSDPGRSQFCLVCFWPV